MKKWSKILISVVAISMLAMFAGCSKDATELSKWQQIQDAGVITVGNSPDYPPFETIDDQGNRVGFDVDLMEAIAAELGVEIEFKTMEFGTIVDAVKSGQIDIGMSGFSITPDRLEKVDFTDAYFVGGQVVLTTLDSGVEKLEDLKEETVAVQMGTTCEQAALTIKGANVTSLDDFNVAVMMLKNNSVKAVVADISVAQQYVEQEDFVVVGEPLTYEETAIIVQKGNDDLVQALNDALAQVKEDGKWEELRTKWELQ